jgi:hypothetical protein
MTVAKTSPSTWLLKWPSQEIALPKIQRQLISHIIDHVRRTGSKCTKKIVRTKGAADTHGQERERQILGDVGFPVDIALPMSELHEVAERQADNSSDCSPKNDLVWICCQQPDLPFVG